MTLQLENGKVVNLGSFNCSTVSPFQGDHLITVYNRAPEEKRLHSCDGLHDVASWRGPFNSLLFLTFSPRMLQVNQQFDAQNMGDEVISQI